MPPKRPREAAPDDIIPVPDFIECYRSIKVGLKNLLKDSHALSKIEALVLLCNIFVTEAYQFIRLFILHKFHRHAPLPKIDRAFIICVFMTWALICRGCVELPSNKNRFLNNNRFVNRDVNAAVNIMNMAKHWVQSHNRPQQFSR